jgi:hypothetical protein
LMAGSRVALTAARWAVQKAVSSVERSVESSAAYLAAQTAGT